MTLNVPLLSIEQERERRLQSRQNEGSEVHEQFLTTLRSASQEPVLQERMIGAYRFAQSIDYHHAGLSPKAYLVHPVRVALMALQTVVPIEPDIIITALLHNVLEVSPVPVSELSTRFGSNIAQTISNLTVDRALQEKRDYKLAYYARLQSAGKTGRVVKVLDKLDNLFLLCLNPDQLIRSNYLAEIEEFILPLAHQDLPLLDDYLLRLIQNCRDVGYLKAVAGQRVT
jgi:(p)ppGpp synthase/HD superfamily hydrolase